jgi:hypothetical protein
MERKAIRSDINQVEEAIKAKEFKANRMENHKSSQKYKEKPCNLHANPH